MQFILFTFSFNTACWPAISNDIIPYLTSNIQRCYSIFSVEAVVQRCSVKKGVPRNCAKFTGKHLYQSVFFNKVADLRPATLLKKRLWHRCFPVNFAQFLGTPFFTEHLWWLLLSLACRTFLLLCVFNYQRRKHAAIILSSFLFKRMRRDVL